MKPGYRVILRNAEQEVEYVEDFVSELSATNDTRKLWRAWSGLLEHYVKAVAAMRRATSEGRSKAWSDHLLNAQRNDAILKYAFEAKNHATHVFESEREAIPRTVTSVNFLLVGGNSSVTLSNNVVIGPDGNANFLPDGVLETKDGRYVGGTISRAEVQEHEHFIALKDVKTRSGTWAVPNPNTPREKQAIEIGEHVIYWLKLKLDEALNLANQEN